MIDCVFSNNILQFFFLICLVLSSWLRINNELNQNLQQFNTITEDKLYEKTNKF